MLTSRGRFKSIDWTELDCEAALILRYWFNLYFWKAGCWIILCRSPFRVVYHNFIFFTQWSHFLLLEAESIDQWLFFLFNRLTMCHLNRWLFKGKVVLFIISLSDSYRIISAQCCWHIAMETNSISLVLSIRNSTAYSNTYTRLSSSSTGILCIRLLIILS